MAFSFTVYFSNLELLPFLIDNFLDQMHLINLVLDLPFLSGEFIVHFLSLLEIF